MDAIKGMHGYWHAADGSWLVDSKVATLCGGRGVAPGDHDEGVKKVNCPKCLLIIARAAITKSE